MHLSELKAQHVSELIKMGEALEIENVSRMRKQELMFACLKQLSARETDIIGEGVVEVLQDGFGFLRSPDANYLAGPDDIYVSPNQVRKWGLRTGDIFSNAPGTRKVNTKEIGDALSKESQTALDNLVIANNNLRQALLGSTSTDPIAKAKVEEYYGGPLADFRRDADVQGFNDHMGWEEQGDGRWFYGLNIENGRIKDEGSLRLKAGLRAILGRFGMEVRLTALQSLILCDIEPGDRAEIERMMAEYGILRADQLSLLRRYSIACPAFPTCGLSITEAERALPGVIDQLEQEVAKLGLQSDKLAVHMTGCPNGCARPYTPDIGLVGKAAGKYTVFVGGNPEGTRLGFIYRDMVPLEEIVPALVPLLQRYRVERTGSESFGDFCARRGPEAIGAVS